MSANLDIELLRTLHVTLRFGRFLTVASHLNRSPSVVGTHVRRLEELAGGWLFEHDNQSVRLTSLGQRLQRQAVELLETYDHVPVGLRRWEESLWVRFGISEEYAGKLLGRFLPCLGVELPALELEVLTDASGRLAGRLRRGQLDLVLLVQTQDETPYDGRSCEIGGTQPVRVAGYGLRIDPRCPLPLALYGQDCPYRRALLEALGATGRCWRTVVSSSGAAVLEVVIEGGLATGVINRAWVDPTMRALRPAEGFAELSVHRTRLAFTPEERPPVLERLGELITEEFRL